MAIALATGVGGHVLDASDAAPAADPARANASSPFRQLGSLLRVPVVRAANARTAFTEPVADRALSVDVQASSPGGAAPLTVQRRPLPRQPQPLLQIQALALATRPLAAGDRITAPVTFYYCEEAAGGTYPSGDGGAFCGHVRDGTVVRPGMAACDYTYLGQRFRIEGDPTGRIYVCGDTGSAIHGLARDIWFLDNRSGWLWQRTVGTSAVIEILPPE